MPNTNGVPVHRKKLEGYGIERGGKHRLFLLVSLSADDEITCRSHIFRRYLRLHVRIRTLPPKRPGAANISAQPLL